MQAGSGADPAGRAPYARDMAEERGARSGYEWEDDPVPSEPEPLVLPDRHRAEGQPAVPVDHGAPARAPRSTDPPRSPSADPSVRRGALPPWAIVAIVVVQAVAQVAGVALVVGGLQRLIAEDRGTPGAVPAAGQPTDGQPTDGQPTDAQPTDAQPTDGQPAAGDPPQQSGGRDPGTVTDAAGREVTDGTGGYDRPATVGEHTVSWTAWTDGTLGVAALDVDLAATLPAADGQDVIQEGYRLVLVTFEVRYDGPGQLAPAEELWLTGESDRTFFPDVAEGLVPDPMRLVGPLEGGETARFRSAFVVPDGETDSLRLTVETFTGEPLYFAAD